MAGAFGLDVFLSHLPVIFTHALLPFDFFSCRRFAAAAADAVVVDFCHSVVT